MRRSEWAAIARKIQVPQSSSCQITPLTHLRMSEHRSIDSPGLRRHHAEYRLLRGAV